jgi:hypothetical protein
MAGLASVVLVVAAHEAIIFATSTEASARDAAKQDFLDECKRRQLDPVEFKGPQRIKSPERTYGFVWINPSNGDQIVTMVRYFPAGVESWMSRDQNGKFEPYCGVNDQVCHK